MRKGSRIVAMALAAACLFGCARGTAGQPTPSASEPPVVLTAMIQQSRYYSGLQAMIRKLEEEENIFIDCQLIPDNQFLDMMKMKLNSGESADLIDYNLPDIFDRINPDKYCADLSDEPWVENLIDRRVVERDGKIYGFPFQRMMGVHGVVYNREVFERLGLEVPRSWDEFLAVCEAVKQRGEGITPVYLSRESWVPQIWMSDNMSKALGADGLRSFAAQVLQNKTKWTDRPELAGVIDHYLSLFGGGYVNEDYLTASYEMAIDAMAEGRAAMHLNGDFFAASVLENNPDAQIGMFVLSMPGARQPDAVTVNPASIGFIAYKNSEKLDTVKKVFQLWSTPAYADLYFQSRPGFPGFKGVNGGEIAPYLEEINRDYIMENKVLPEFSSMFGITKTVFESDLWLLYLEAPVKRMDGEAVLAQFQQDYEAFMRENLQPDF